MAIALLTLPLVGRPQVVQTGRIEVPVHQDGEAFVVLPMDTAGTVLYRTYHGPKQNEVEIVRLDTALQQLWKGFLAVPKDLTLAVCKAYAGKIYFIHKSLNPASKNFVVYAMSIQDGGYTTFAIKNLIQFNPTEFVVSKKAILIGGYFNFRPLVLHYSIQDQRARILPGFLNEPGELTQIKTYSDGNVDVIISARNNNRKKCLWIRHFDENGDLVKTVVLEPDENKNLIFGRAAKMGNDNQVIAGVYGRGTEYSRGIFVAEVNPYGEYAIKYYNFADLANFFHYMKARREKRIKDRIERRRVKGKKNKFNYRFLVHELIPYNGQFIMLGEAFFPTYSTRPGFYAPPYSTYSPWNYGLNSRNFYNSTYRSDLVFDGFQYTHAVVIGFDQKAKLNWDNSFEINGLKSFQLEQLVKLVPAGNKLALLYIFENAIRSKIIKDNSVLEGTVQDPIATSDAGKMKTKIQSSKLEYWYGNHLLIYGIQDYRDKSNDLVRKVFFINKVTAK